MPPMRIVGKVFLARAGGEGQETDFISVLAKIH